MHSRLSEGSKIGIFLGDFLISPEWQSDAPGPITTSGQAIRSWGLCGRPGRRQYCASAAAFCLKVQWCLARSVSSFRMMARTKPTGGRCQVTTLVVSRYRSVAQCPGLAPLTFTQRCACFCQTMAAGLDFVPVWRVAVPDRCGGHALWCMVVAGRDLSVGKSGRGRFCGSSKRNAAAHLRPAAGAARFAEPRGRLIPPVLQ